MKGLLLIAAGGALGSVLRYAASGLSHRLLGETFPWGTLIVNLLGCLAIGFFWALFERTTMSPGTRLFLFIGVLGAFTTFSTYGIESLNLARDGEVIAVIGNIAAHNLGGLVLVAVGFMAARLLFSASG